MKRDKLHLPPLPIPVEVPTQVRTRALARMRFLCVLMCASLLVVGGAGVNLCISPSEQTLKEASKKRWKTVNIEAGRGEIFDRNGRRLAMSIQVPSVQVDPKRIPMDQVDAFANELGAVLGQDPSELANLIRERKTQQPNSQHMVVKRSVHPKVEHEVRKLRTENTLMRATVDIQKRYDRFYPEAPLMAHVLGIINQNGQGSGLEYMYHDLLQGDPIQWLRRRDKRNGFVDEPPSYLEDERGAGMSLHTTLDRQIQWFAERALERVVERSAPAAACVVVVEVGSGDILAMANVPSFDPHRIDSDPTPRRNHCVQDVFEPGSVMKPFVVAAALEEGMVHPDSLMETGAAYRVGRKAIRDDHPHDTMTVSEVVKYSSNIGATKLILELGADRALGYLRDFGFGTKTGAFKGERTGKVRDAKTVKRIELATTAYGYGMNATPVQLAMAMAALADGGILPQARLVDHVVDAHGNLESRTAVRPVRRVVSEETAAAVTKMLVSVTETGGTATRAAIDGYSVAGKTGTAEKVENGSYGAERVSSFAGYLPAEDPKIVVVVMVDSPSKGSRYGGVVAAPAFAEIGEQSMLYLGIQPTLKADASVQPLETAQRPAKTPLLMAWEPPGGWSLPDFSDRTMRDVLASLNGTGLAVDIAGSGRLVSQHPPAGSLLVPGSNVRLEFH
jgi:cell division protein FtsI (penicillin-binding protein 3)